MALTSALHHDDVGYSNLLQKMRRGKSSAVLHRRLTTINQLVSDLSTARDLDDVRDSLTAAYACWLPEVTMRLLHNQENHLNRNEGASRDIAFTWTRTACVPIYIEDTLLSLDGDIEALNPLPMSRSIMALPLRASGRVLGCLVLMSPRPRRFTMLDYNLSLLAAAHVASVLDHLLARQQLAETNSRLHYQEQELMALNRQLQELAHKDDLTGLYNRRRLLVQIDCETARLKRYGGELSCMMIDLDGFKPINDSYGHRAGDEVLSELGELFRTSCRETDFVARYGGDEFTILLPQTDAHGAACAAEKLRRKVDEHLFTLRSGQTVSLTISVGIVTMPEDRPLEASEIIARADDALYCSKHSGGNAVFSADRCGGGSRICQLDESTLTHYARSA